QCSLPFIKISEIPLGLPMGREEGCPSGATALCLWHAHKPAKLLTLPETLVLTNRGIRLTRDSEVSVVYAEGLNSTTSSVMLQSTDRHGIVGQKPPDFQESL